MDAILPRLQRSLLKRTAFNDDRGWDRIHVPREARRSPTLDEQVRRARAAVTARGSEDAYRALEAGIVGLGLAEDAAWPSPRSDAATRVAVLGLLRWRQAGSTDFLARAFERRDGVRAFYAPTQHAVLGTLALFHCNASRAYGLSFDGRDDSTDEWLAFAAGLCWHGLAMGHPEDVASVAELAEASEPELGRALDGFRSSRPTLRDPPREFEQRFRSLDTPHRALLVYLSMPEPLGILVGDLARTPPRPT